MVFEVTDDAYEYIGPSGDAALERTGFPDL